MSNPIHVVLLLALLAFWIAPAYYAGRVADGKGRSFGVYLVAGLVIGPFVLVVALLLPRSHRLA
jgi:hypothetical protein